MLSTPSTARNRKALSYLTSHRRVSILLSIVALVHRNSFVSYLREYQGKKMQEYMFPAQDLTEIFSDLDRVPQDDGHEPVCVIQYPTSFTIAYDYMRAVWKAKEFSGM